MARRNIELVLLFVAAPVVVLLFVMLALNEGEQLGLTTLGVPLGIFAAFFAAHLAVRKFAPGADPALLPISFALSGIGIAFITRITPYSDNPDMATNQVIWLFLGVLCMVLVMAVVRNLDKVANYKYTLMLVGFVLLLSPLIPGIGTEINGSQIWLRFGNLSFQPGEIAKVVIVLFLAGYLAQNREMLSVFTWRLGPFRLPDARTLLPLLLMWGMAMLIVAFEKDLGSALVLFFVFLVMLYVATGKKFYLVVGLGLIAIGAVAAYAAFSHVQVRVSTWLDPFSDAQGTGYQLTQALYSIADGGLFGVGVGNGLAGGTDSFSAIPVVESDFIFADIAEEIGLLGSGAVMLLFLCFAMRGFLTAARAKSDVSSFVAVGLTSVIVIQAFVIVGGVTRLIPLTGLTLPFISQGGSSLVGSFIMVGLLLRAGDEGTGVESEMTNATGQITANGVLGRVSLGKRLTGTMTLFSLLFAVLLGNLTLIMVAQADEYRSMDGNNHTLLKESSSERGTISTYDGMLLAYSALNENGTYDRVYPQGTFASHVLGYFSNVYGSSGIEAACDDELTGSSTSYSSWTDVIDDMAGITSSGSDVALTLDSQIQQAAESALSGSTGAAVVMDPDTGAVLGMASSPTYSASDIEGILAGTVEAENGSLLNRATQTLYTPGSTFKIVTLATALENDVAEENTVFSSPGTMEIGNAEVSNFDEASYGNITLSTATAYSSNTVYAQLGVQMGAEMLVSGAEAFGFNQSISFPVTIYTSLMADPSEMTEWETAWASAGQPVNPMNHASPAGPQSTVLQMALVGCAIANDGVIMQPYLVDSVYDPDGTRTYTTQPTEWLQAVSEDTADRVYEVLKGVVEYGTGTDAAIDGVEVAGKTGTAEKTGGNDIWFVGMATVNDQSVVVAIVIENGEEGIAAEKAHDILETALEVQGLL